MFVRVFFLISFLFHEMVTQCAKTLLSSATYLALTKTSYVFNTFLEFNVERSCLVLTGLKNNASTCGKPKMLLLLAAATAIPEGVDFWDAIRKFDLVVIDVGLESFVSCQKGYWSPNTICQYNVRLFCQLSYMS